MKEIFKRCLSCWAFYLYFFYILQGRAAGVGCFSHVWCLLSREMLFSTMQRGWLYASENERKIKIEERQNELWFKHCTDWHISENASGFASFQHRGKYTLKSLPFCDVKLLKFLIFTCTLQICGYDFGVQLRIWFYKVFATKCVHTKLHC